MNLKLKDGPSPEPSVVEIEKLVYGGDGLARVNGQVVLVPFVLPGESVRTQTERVKTGLLRGRDAEIVVPAADRVTPSCEYFGDCGGCQYQHSSYEAQVQHKRSILLETLARLGSISTAPEVKIITAEPWNYRNRVQLHFDGRKMGFHRPGSHQLCAIDHCPISSPVINEVIQKLSVASRQNAWPDFLRSLEVFTNETDVQLNVLESDRPVAARFFEWCAELIPQFAPGSIQYRAVDQTFRISGGSFFQVNRFLHDQLVTESIGGMSGKSAVDLYAGVGLFTLPLAKQFEKVDAVERGGHAFGDLQFNARSVGANIASEKGSAEDYLRRLQDAPQLVLADPPRTGLGKDATNELLRLQAPNVVIISCDPTTLARDLKKLLTVYHLDSLTLIDLFPQTYHLETIAKLTLL